MENTDNPIIVVSCAYEGQASHTGDQEIAFLLLYDEKGAGAEGESQSSFGEGSHEERICGGSESGFAIVAGASPT